MSSLGHYDVVSERQEDRRERSKKDGERQDNERERLKEEEGER